jgi:hypothetical protein
LGWVNHEKAGETLSCQGEQRRYNEKIMIVKKQVVEKNIFTSICCSQFGGRGGGER